MALIREENVKIKDFIKLAMSILLCQLAGVVGSLFTIPAIPTWYKTLKKPFFTPPDWILGKAAGLLLLPYMFWVSFAAFLNFALWILNT